MKNLFFYILLFNLSFVFSQKQASNWYFGENAGINFNSNTSLVSALNDGKVNTREGCASISDINGELLFYTDGITVYNRSHQVMQGGNGLLGDASSTQSAIIVPKPEDPDIYYIFTVGSNISNTGLHYSVVNIEQNGGLGSVITKNIRLLSHCAEKISAVAKDCVSGDIWVVALSSNDLSNSGVYDTFYSFLVSVDGISNNPIKSAAGVVIQDPRGYLKLSPNSKKLACANVGSGLYLYDFDSERGLISNPIFLQINHISNKPYGVEFSPNGHFLYVSSSNDFFVGSEENNNPANHTSVLLQFNLNAGNIAGSQIVLDSRQLFRGALQLGPDGKIYRALSATYQEGLPFLGVIENPNNLGLAANYKHNAISLDTKTSSQGLPPFVQSFFTEKIDIIRNGKSSTSLTLCEGESYVLTADNIPNANYIWTFNGAPLPENDFDMEVTESGDYEVSIGFEGDECSSLKGQAIVKFVTSPLAFNGILIQCEDDIIDGVSLFNLNESFNYIVRGNQDVFLKFYKTYDDAVNNENAIGANYKNVTNPQTIYAEVINNGIGEVVGDDFITKSNCNTIVELTLVVNSTQTNYLHFTSCDELGSEDGINTFSINDFTPQVLANLPSGLDLTVSYYRNYNDALLKRSAIGNNYTNRTPYSQTIYYRVENSGSCYGINEIQLTINKLPNIETAYSTFYCLNDFPHPITLDGAIIDNSPDDYTYNWSTGENTYTIQVNEIGNYTVIATNANGCSKERTVIVEASNIATIKSIEIIDTSLNNSINIVATGEGEYQYALYDQFNRFYANFQSDNFFDNVSPGIYTVHITDIKNNCGIVQEQVSIIGFPKYFTPNNDGHNDTWQVLGVSSMFQPNSKILIFNRYGKLLKQLSPQSKGWDGIYNGKVLPNDDYWFAVTLQDGRIFKNHFTLKR